VERYYADTKDKQRVPAAVFERQVDEMRGIIATLRSEHEKIRMEIVSAKENVGVGDAVATEEGRLRDELRKVVEEEKALASRVLGRLPPAERAKAEQAQNVLERVRGVEQQLAGLHARIEQAVDERLKETRQILMVEKGKLAGYKQQVAECERDSAMLGGIAAMLALKAARERAYNLVVEADVGVTDVAWMLKDTKTQTITKLQDAKTRELRLLEEEFQQVRESK